MRIAVPCEKAGAERRVALVPEVVQRLCSQGLELRVQTDAGSCAEYTDEDYRQAGATVVKKDGAYEGADLVLRVSPPTPEELRLQPEGSALAGFLNPYRGKEALAGLAERRLSAFAMETVPRSSRAQAMDALSSQRSVAGYRAVVAAAAAYGRFFPMLTGPTGTVRPAAVLVLGAGVAGLQAIATARRLGAVVEVSDIRPAAREQVESLGGRFLSADIKAEAEGGYARELTAEERQAQGELLAQHVARAGVLIATAEVPGRPAPRIVSAAMVEKMRAGTLVLDLAAASGGNCELTRPGERYRHNGVEIWGPLNMAAEMAPQASDLYARNLERLLQLLVRDGRLAPDWEDEIVAAACIARDGELRLPELGQNTPKTAEREEGDS